MQIIYNTDIANIRWSNGYFFITIGSIMIKRLQKHIIRLYKIPPAQLVFYAIVFIIILIFLYIIGSEVNDRFGFIFTEEGIERFITGAGVWSWLVYIGLIAFMVLSPLPSSIIVLVGGYLFNPLFMIILTIIGESLGATSNFFIGRKIGKSFILKHSRKLRKMFEMYGEHINPQTVFFLAMIPVGTSNITGYLAGMSELKYKRYIISWITGVSFINFIISLLGYSARSDNYILSGIIVLIGVALFLMLRKFFRQDSIIDIEKTSD